MTDTARSAQIDAFLDASGWSGAERTTLADDASFRRYERIACADRRAVLMDAPPVKEDVRPFRHVAGVLTSLGFSAPDILAADEENGFLLLEDLGDDTYTRVLARDDTKEEALYTLATDTLIDLHRRYQDGADVPNYDKSVLVEREARLLTEWYWPAIHGTPCPAPVRAEFDGLWMNALSHAYSVPLSLVLRDYHVDNLIHLPDRQGTAQCGLLDFQDALIGPVTYDLVSLLEDARRDVPRPLAGKLIGRYLDAFPTLPPDALLLSYAVLGVQRATKIIGIFTRLDRRDGKSQYLKHIDRTWRWLEGGLNHPMLFDLRTWYDSYFPRDMRRAPPPAPGERADERP